MLYQHAPQIEWRQFEEEALLLDLNTGSYYRLNSVGSTIWQMLDGHTTVAEIIDAIQHQFAVSHEEAARDCQHFLTQLIENNLIVEVV